MSKKLSFPVIIAVASDLHVGAARAKDLCLPTVSGVEAAEAIDADYLPKFSKFVDDHGITADYLMVPGDFTHRAKPDEVQLASEVITKIGAALKVPEGKIMIVPGNHDVDWSVLDLDDHTGLRHNQRYAALENPQWIFRAVMCDTQNLLLPPHFSCWETEDLVVVGYNSSWHDNPKIVVHHGLISPDDVIALVDYLSKVDLTTDRIRALLIHHHPIQYSDPIAEIPDFSAMTNASRLLSELRAHRFDLLVHGHKHNPNFTTYAIDGGPPLAILGAGSFSAMLDTRWSGTVSNQFHRIIVEGRDPDNGCIYGKVENWAYNCARGWIRSDLNAGITHIVPFGTYLQPSQLERVISPHLATLLRRRNYVEWQSVLNELPVLRYVQTKVILEVLDRIAPKLGLTRHGDTEEKIILLKKEGGNGRARKKR